MIHMKKISNKLNVLFDTSEGFGYFFGATLISFLTLLFFTFCLTSKTKNIFDTVLPCSIIINLTFCVYLWIKIHNIIKHAKKHSLDDIKRNNKLIRKLSMEHANDLLLTCLEMEDYEMANLLKKHILKLNKNKINVN